MIPVAPTTLRRVTVSTAAVELVPAEDYVRRIVLNPPASPQMFYAIDETGDAIADCRAYNWAPLAPGFPVEFSLLPGQFVWAIADTAGMNPIGVLCEYLQVATPLAPAGG